MFFYAPRERRNNIQNILRKLNYRAAAAANYFAYVHDKHCLVPGSPVKNGT